MIVAFDTETGETAAYATCDCAGRWRYTYLVAEAVGNFAVHGDPEHPKVAVNPKLEDRFRFESYTELEPVKSKALRGLEEIELDKDEEQ